MSRRILAVVVATVATAAVVAAALAEPGPAARGPGDWGVLQPSPLQRTEVAAARIGDGIYVLGGFLEPGSDTGRMVRYSISEDEWTELAPLPLEVNHPGVTAAGGDLYAFGGNRASAGFSDRLYRYDPGADDWTRLDDASKGRMAMAFAAIGSRLYAAGGKTAGRDRSRLLEIYNTQTERWRHGPGLKVGRNHIAGTVSGGLLYAIGGRPGAIHGGRRTVERYDPSKEQWKTLAPLETARSGAVAATLDDGRIAVFGGEERDPGGETIEEVELFEPGTGEWSALPYMLTPRHGLGGVAQGSRIHALEGGPQPRYSFSDANEFLDVPD